MTEKILGLDLGTNSVGWALFENGEGEEDAALLGVGVRVFPEPVEAKTRVPKNAKRRMARLARRNLGRRRQRRKALKIVLTKAGLLPSDPAALEKLLFDHSINPYVLRARGLTEQLTLHEFGRALYHLNQRRGYLSNRRASRVDQVDDPEVRALIEAEERSEQEKARLDQERRQSNDEEKVVLAGIATLKAQLESKGKPLGAYFADELDDGNRVRSRHTERSMYREEFELLWSSQAKFYPQVLTDGLRANICRIIFFQRPLKVQRFLVSNCPFETNRHRAMKAYSIAHEFRIAQEVNNLTVDEARTFNWRPLTEAERATVRDALNSQKTIKWSKIRSLLRLDRSALFNLESDSRTELKGNDTRCFLREALGETFDGLTDSEREALEAEVINQERKDALVRRLRNHWKLSAEQAYNLATWEPESGTMSYSVKAIRKLLPHLLDGLSLWDACVKAGYSIQQTDVENHPERLPKPPDFRNPTVNQAAHQVRRVVNAIVAKYGKPDVIRIEMARDMKLNKKEKAAVQKQQAENKKANDQARSALAGVGISSPSRLDLIKYRLWQECNGICPYTGKCIPLSMLKTGEVDIEHIIPYSRSLDDSFNNLTLCFVEENRNVKRNKTPFEAYGHDPQRWIEMLTRVKPFKRRKRILFERESAPEEITEEFAARALSDTRYICRAVKDYVQQIGSKTTVTKGESTALLRRAWCLNTILAKDGEAEKNREDHRHHAIDAIVVAQTSTSLFQRLSRESARTGGSLLERSFSVPVPFANFWQTVKDEIEKVVVSHAPDRKITGAFHEETAYGLSTDASGKARLVFRKPLADGLTAGEIERVRDPHLRSLIRKSIEEARSSPDADLSGASEEKCLKHALKDSGGLLTLKDKRGQVVLDKHGRPRMVRSVRLLSDPLNPDATMAIADNSGEPYKFFKLGSYHHVEVLECLVEHTDTSGKQWREGQKKGLFVSTIEAARRARIDRKSVVQRDHGTNWNYIMSLARNDILRVPSQDDNLLFRVQKLNATNNSVSLRPIVDGTVDDKSRTLTKAINQLDAMKFTVGPLGDLHPTRE